MASRKPNAPRCRTCGRSNGISGEVSAGVVWRNGAWRYSTDPEGSVEASGPDLVCECGSYDIEI